jgi:histone-binding protein RBBP4
VINEEYKYWKKQSPNQYDMIFSQGLEWPSITFEWLPSLEEEEGEERTYKALIGSNAN